MVWYLWEKAYNFFPQVLLIPATIPPKFEKLERFLLNDATIG